MTAEAGFRIVRLDEIPPIRPGHWPLEADPGEVIWRPVRHFLGIRSFGVNAFSVYDVDGRIVGDHTEDGPESGGHEELYVVIAGRAIFSVAGETHQVDAPAFVFVSDPRVRRSARAATRDTVVLVVGGEPGKAYEPSVWELKYLSDR